MKLPGNYRYLATPFGFSRGNRFGMWILRERLNLMLGIIQHARRIARIVKQEKCDAIVACTGDVTLIPAAYLASRYLNIPYYAYVFDHYSYREWRFQADVFWARLLEPRLMKTAAAVITTNDVLGDDLRQRFGIDALVIHNALDISVYQAREVQASPGTTEIKITYTGDVYEAHYDAFRNLIAAISQLARPEIKLHLYTDRPISLLTNENITANDVDTPVVRHPHLTLDEMPSIQMQSDVLFLALAFDSPYPDLVRTSATTKLGEYMAAGRPILVHAPLDSFVSLYVRRYDCGVVVDVNETACLAEAIDRILSDEELRQRITANARERAQADFDIVKARTRFAEVLEMELSA